MNVTSYPHIQNIAEVPPNFPGCHTCILQGPNHAKFKTVNIMNFGTSKQPFYLTRFCNSLCL